MRVAKKSLTEKVVFESAKTLRRWQSKPCAYLRKSVPGRETLVQRPPGGYVHCMLKRQLYSQLNEEKRSR